MAVVSYKKFKVLTESASKGAQGLQPGDIVMREYFSSPNLIYSLMCVLEIGTGSIDITNNGVTTTKTGDYFIGALLSGSEPSNDQPMNFVRITNLWDSNRLGSIYMTASDSGSPYIDICDGVAVEQSLCYPENINNTSYIDQFSQYNILGKDYLKDISYSKSISTNYRVCSFTRNSTSLPSATFVGLSQTLKNNLGNPNEVIVSYKIKASRTLTGASLTVGDTNNIDGVVSVDISTDWVYKLHTISIDNVESVQKTFKLDLSSVLQDGDVVQISDLNVILLSSVSNYVSGMKARFGNLSGVVDSVFGELVNYGAYVQRLYAAGQVNISGTITAGDENGFGSTFYAGKISKNLLKNSLSCEFLGNAPSIVTDIPSPVNIGNIYGATNSNFNIAVRDNPFLFANLGKKVCFSFWVYGALLNDAIVISQNSKSISSVTVSEVNVWKRYSISFNLLDPVTVGDSLIINLAFSGQIHFTAPQLEYGTTPTQYQATDAVLDTTSDYGAWMSRGGIGGTIQNPLLKFNSDGSIAGKANSFMLRNDGSGYFANTNISWNASGDVEIVGSITIKSNGKSIEDALADVQSASALDASGKVSALSTAHGGFTYISSTGIYTGTLTAGQVNAVAIDAASITTGYLNADRINTGAINADKIAANSITTEKLSADLFSAGYINSDYINANTILTNALSAGTVTAGTATIKNLIVDNGTFTNATVSGKLTSSEGALGGWLIGSNYLKSAVSGGIELQSSGTITSPGHWGLNADGSCFFANNNVTFAANGDAVFRGSFYLTSGQSVTSYTDTAINNVQIGGVNLLRNTGNFTDTSYWKDGDTLPVIVTDSNTGYKCLKISTTIDDQPSGYITMLQHFKGLKPSTQYTLSFYYSTGYDNGMQIDIVDESLSSNTVQLAGGTVGSVGSFSKYEKTFTTGSSVSVLDTCHIWFVCWAKGTNSLIEIANIKLEEGNKATAWSLASEDVTGYTDTSIANIQVGGTNLLSNGDFHNYRLGWTYTAGTQSIVTDSIYGKMSQITLSNAVDDTFGNNVVNPSISSNYITFSCIVISTDGSLYPDTFGFVVYYTDGTYDDYTWTTYSSTLITGTYYSLVKTGAININKTVSSIQTRIYRHVVGTGSYRIGNVKLENGNKATAYTQSISEVRDYVDSVEVGGTNLLLNSDFHSGYDGVNSNGATSLAVVATGDIQPNPTQCLCVVCPSAGAGFYYSSSNNYIPKIFESGQKYTLSFWGQVSTNVNLRYGAEEIEYTEVYFTPGWKKYSYTFTGNGTASAIIFYPLAACTFYIGNIKLETGTKATDWCLAPSETETATSIAASFQMSGDTISLFGKTINISGATVFNNIQASTTVTVDATGLDPNTYYPVTIDLNSYNGQYHPSTILVSRGLSSTYGVPSYSTHSEGFSVYCSWQTNGYGYGSIPIVRIINSYTTSFSTATPIGSIGQMGLTSQEYIYVRGGSKYDVQINKPNITITLRTASYTDSQGYTIGLLTSVVAPVDDLTTAKTNLATNIGYTSYDAMVSSAAANQTIINGGYIRTSLVEATAVVTNGLSAQTINANNATLQNLNVTTGTFTTITIASATITGTLACNSATFTQGTFNNITIGGATITGTLSCNQAVFNSMVIHTATITDATISGTLSAVSGTFSSLSPIHSGTAQGSMNFDSTYGMCFNGLDIGQQGQKNSRGLRFYSGDIRCRGMLGTHEKSMVYIQGYLAIYYPNGYSTTDYVTVTLTETGTGARYVPLYPGITSAEYDGTAYVGNPTVHGNALYADLSGLPIDLVVINNSSTVYRYTLVGNTGKHVTVVNACDTKECYITTNGNTGWELNGGCASEWVNLYGLITPSRTNEGAGWLCTGVNDNNWN